MQIIRLTPQEAIKTSLTSIALQKEGFYYCVADDNYAIVGSQGGSDRSMISKLGAILATPGHEGGTIVTSPGDVQIGFFTKGFYGNVYRDLVINAFISFFETKGLNVTRDGNDIMVDGKKVIGYGSHMHRKLLFTTMQVSIGLNEKMIEKICTKTRKKIPGGLSAYGITTEDITQILEKVFSELNESDFKEEI